MSLSNPPSHLLHFQLHSPPPPAKCLFFTGDRLFRSSPIRLRQIELSLFLVPARRCLRINCVTKSMEESESLSDDEGRVELNGHGGRPVQENSGPTGSARIAPGFSSDSLLLGIREPVYEVVEVKCDGMISTRKINRRHLLKAGSLRPRDIRSVDPSLWLTNTMPSLLVREHAILLNLGSLRAIAMEAGVFIFNYDRKGGKAFIDALLPRLNPKNMNVVPSMPFVLEVVEAALHSRIQRLEQRLMDLEPRVQSLLEVLPNRLTADILEELRISKQTLVELGSKAGALKQMLLDILEDSDEIRRICIIGRNCTLKKGHEVECSVPLEKLIAEEEEEEIEMLLENYLQRCDSCHGQAERLLDSAKEMEDSIAVNLSSRRLEVSRVELLLQVGAFCVAVGALVAGTFVEHVSRHDPPLLKYAMVTLSDFASLVLCNFLFWIGCLSHEPVMQLVAGIFGMNLKSYLEDHVLAFWATTAGIIVGAVIAFILMYSYLRKRKIL